MDPAVAAYWREHYDIAHPVETQWPRLKRHLDGKLHVTVGSDDSDGLATPVRGLEAAFHEVGGSAEFIYVPGAAHSMAQVYAKSGDRLALYKDLTNAMYAIARPNRTAR